jgi:hypothetical protein
MNERLEIEIDPETLEYKLDIHMVKLSNLQGVLEDILEKIKNGELSEECNVYPINEEDPLDPLG